MFRSCQPALTGSLVPNKTGPDDTTLTQLPKNSPQSLLYGDGLVWTVCAGERPSASFGQTPTDPLGRVEVVL